MPKFKFTNRPNYKVEYWQFFGYNGDDMQHTYPAATPPNPGEVEHPLSETPYSEVIMRYNGLWGAFSRKNFSPSAAQHCTAILDIIASG